MRIFLVLAFLNSVFFQVSQAQIIQNDSLKIRLSPIFIQGNRFYHNQQRVSFDALTYLFSIMNDDGLNKAVKSVYTLRSIRNFLGFGSLIYSIIILNSSNLTYVIINRANYILLGAVLLSYPLAIMEVSYQKKAIRRYNELLLKLRHSASTTPTDNS